MTTDTPARPTQPERSARMRGRLLDAAVDSLVEVGYARSSTQEIARRAGVSRGAQLHHFPTKESLLVAAVGHLVSLRLDEVLALDRDAGLDVLMEVFSGPLFYAALEMWVAARTDPALHLAMVPLERQVTDAIAEGGREFFGTEMSQEAFELSVELARGLAVSAIFRSPDAESTLRERLLPVWEAMVKKQ